MCGVGVVIECADGRIGVVSSVIVVIGVISVPISGRIA